MILVYFPKPIDHNNNDYHVLNFVVIIFIA